MASLVIGVMLFTSMGAALGGTGIEALFFARFGVEYLPYMFVGLGITSMIMSFGITALLSRIPAATVVDLDAGCCGMAGSFGYAREHFEVSRAIGERRLLPAARTLAAGAVLVASGVSCRHQVHDFTGVRAVHAAELLRSLIREPA